MGKLLEVIRRLAIVITWLIGGAIGLGYVACTSAGETAETQLQSHYQIDVAGQKVDADVSFKPMYDPKSEQVRF